MTIHCSKSHTIFLTPSILVTIKDAANRVIDSVNSVPVTWTVSSSYLGSVSAPGTLISHPVDKDEVAEPGSPYQVLVVTRQMGEVDITATIARDGEWGSTGCWEP
jgi:hypothetical protein